MTECYYAHSAFLPGGLDISQFLKGRSGSMGTWWLLDVLSARCSGEPEAIKREHICGRWQSFGQNPKSLQCDSVETFQRLCIASLSAINASSTFRSTGS